MFKLYKRKIHVWLVQNSNVPGSQHTRHLMYMHSTNAYRTCRDAIAAANAKAPDFKFVANFAKD
jgi:hypothetical protein